MYHRYLIFMNILDIVPYQFSDLRFSNSNDIYFFYPKSQSQLSDR